MHIALRKGQFDAGLGQRAVYHMAQVAGHQHGIGFADVQPILQLELQRVGAEVAEQHPRRRLLEHHAMALRLRQQ